MMLTIRLAKRISRQEGEHSLPHSCCAKLTTDVDMRAFLKRRWTNNCLNCRRKSLMAHQKPGDSSALGSSWKEPAVSCSMDLWTT